GEGQTMQAEKEVVPPPSKPVEYDRVAIRRKENPMTKLHRRTAVALAASIFVLLLGRTAQAADDTAKALDRKELDQRIYKSLREIINRGADLYNSRDPGGCYRLFQGALLTVQSLLDHRPEMQKAIDAGLASAREQAT